MISCASNFEKCAVGFSERREAFRALADYSEYMHSRHGDVPGEKVDITKPLNFRRQMNSQAFRGEISDIETHPNFQKYSPEFSSGPTGAKGFDIGVASVFSLGDKPLDDKSVTGLHPYNGPDVVDGSIATDVTGYPDGKGDFIFGMTGESEKVSSNYEGGTII